MSEILNYHELEKIYGGQQIPYNKLLSTKEWKEKRNSIAKREKYKCKQCHKEINTLEIPIIEKGFIKIVPAKLEFKTINTPIIDPETKEVLDYLNEELPYLVRDYNPIIGNVHHLFYAKDRLPWEYNDEDLIHVCRDCHLEIHRTTEILIYSEYEDKSSGRPIQNCNRCGGLGYLYEYNYHLNGICFSCNGQGYE